MSAPAKRLFLGVGNKDRGDDGIGPRVAEALKDDPEMGRGGVWVSPHFGEGASLMDLWDGAELCVIVDAMKAGGKAGDIRRFEAGVEKLGGGVFHYSSHLFGLAEAVEMARQLKRLPRRLIVFGVESEDFTFGAPFSDGVEAAFKAVVSLVKQEFSGENEDHA